MIISIMKKKLKLQITKSIEESDILNDKMKSIKEDLEK